MPGDAVDGAERVAETLRLRLGEAIDEEVLAADIERARVMLLCYCNIPTEAEMPDGLFEAWCIIAEQNASGGSTDGVSSISEGDVTVSFSKNGSSGGAACDWKTIADRFKRMAV